MTAISTSPTHSTVFHVTHWKAGSQWVYQILRGVATDREVISPTPDMRQVLGEKIVEGAIYPTVYLDSDRFFSITLPADSVWFVIVRDLRDTLVSAYFSLKYSHPLMGTVGVFRSKLTSLSMEGGMLMLLEEWLPRSAEIQKSWLPYKECVWRYEDLIRDQDAIFRAILRRRCGIVVSNDVLSMVLEESSFSKMTGGREMGKEDVSSHLRQGKAGNWRNHFTSLVARRFEQRYGQLAADFGYAP